MMNTLSTLKMRVRCNSSTSYCYSILRKQHTLAETSGQPREREISLNDIKHAQNVISTYLNKTPVVKYVDEEITPGRTFFFKCENLQKTGSFKIRGAMYAAKQHLSKNCNSSNGLVTHSSGNHGLALAMATQMVGLKCAVVAPKTTSTTKLEAISKYGAELVLCEQSMESRISMSKEIRENRGYHYVATSDDYDVITGQATLGLEFLSQVPELDAILVTVSGGGMAAGTCLAVKYLKPECKVFTAEPPGKRLERCLRAEKRLWPNPPRYLTTVAEGLRSQQIGHKNWPILLDHVQRDVFTVSDEDSIRGVQFAMENLKVVIEPSAGTAVAAAISDKMRRMPNLRNIGVVLCGGNVDMDMLSMCLNREQFCQFSSTIL